MSGFTKISSAEWDNLANGGLLQSGWEESIHRTLPFISFEHYDYKNTHALRVAHVGGRLTTAPFSEGGDVIARSKGTLLDLKTFVRDSKDFWGTHVGLKINERLCPVSNVQGGTLQGHEHVVNLEEPLLPRVRKTVRHILEQPLVGELVCAQDTREREQAYLLYLKHMRFVGNFALPRQAFLDLLDVHGGELWVWQYFDTVHAMALFLPTKQEVLYALSASDKRGLTVHAPHHLVYGALTHYQKQGIASGSLGTTGADSSLETFKRGWRGETYSVYEVGNETHRMLRRSRMRLLTRLVPLSLYPSFSAFMGKYFL
jgi:hypothetical protein